MSTLWMLVGYNQLISNKHKWNTCFIKRMLPKYRKLNSNTNKNAPTNYAYGYNNTIFIGHGIVSHNSWWLNQWNALSYDPVSTNFHFIIVVVVIVVIIVVVVAVVVVIVVVADIVVVVAGMHGFEKVQKCFFFSLCYSRLFSKEKIRERLSRMTPAL